MQDLTARPKISEGERSNRVEQGLSSHTGQHCFQTLAVLMREGSAVRHWSGTEGQQSPEFSIVIMAACASASMA